MQTGIVLEGGGLRGMFTNGILDVLMDNNVVFDAMVGVSSGVLFGCNYKSKQPGRALRYNIQYKDNWRYMSWRSWMTTGDYVNARFSYELLPNMYDPFDFKMFKDNPMRFFAVCTDIENGNAVYHEITDAKNEGLQWMRASASMPIFSRPVHIDGHYYLDGGLSDSIPLEFMQNQGYKKNVVILTQPVGYRKGKAPIGIALKIFHSKYPKISELMSNRHIMYNDQLDYIHNEISKGDTFVICPDEKLDIGRLNLDEYKMRKIYRMGAKKALKVLPSLMEFLCQ